MIKLYLQKCEKVELKEIPVQKLYDFAVTYMVNHSAHEILAFIGMIPDISSVTLVKDTSKNYRFSVEFLNGRSLLLNNIRMFEDELYNYFLQN